MKYVIDEETLIGIADAVRTMRHEKEKMTPAQIEAKIRATKTGMSIDDTNINLITGRWERPPDWPDIDALAARLAEDEECVYLTYSLERTPGYGWIGIRCTTAVANGKWTLDRGHIENETFVVDESVGELSTGEAYRNTLDDVNGFIQLWRVTSTDHIDTFYFTSNSTVNEECYYNRLQPVVDRAGNLPYLRRIESVGGQNQNLTYSTNWLEHDSLNIGRLSNVDKLEGAWMDSFNLQSLDLSGWDTSNWGVTTLASCWYNCYNLQTLDLRGLKTSKWRVTNTKNIFAYCYSLRNLFLPESLGIVSTQTTNVGDQRPNLPNVENFNGVDIYVNHAYTNAYKLTPASLRFAFDKLPAVNAVRTIALGQTNKLKLTDLDIAVATQKGWTVA